MIWEFCWFNRNWFDQQKEIIIYNTFWLLDKKNNQQQLLSPQVGYLFSRITLSFRVTLRMIWNSSYNIIMNHSGDWNSTSFYEWNFFFFLNFNWNHFRWKSTLVECKLINNVSYVVEDLKASANHHSVITRISFSFQKFHIFSLANFGRIPFYWPIRFLWIDFIG